MNITRSLLRRSVELTVTQHGERLRSVELYIKETVRKSITREVTVLGDFETYRLVWYLGSRIVHDNPSVANWIFRLM